MKTISYNIQIFRTWFKYILLRIPIHSEALDIMLEHYNATPRELKLLNRIKSLNDK